MFVVHSPAKAPTAEEPVAPSQPASAIQVVQSTPPPVKAPAVATAVTVELTEATGAGVGAGGQPQAPPPATAPAPTPVAPPVVATNPVDRYGQPTTPLALVVHTMSGLRCEITMPPLATLFQLKKRIAAEPSLGAPAVRNQALFIKGTEDALKDGELRFRLFPGRNGDGRGGGALGAGHCCALFLLPSERGLAFHFVPNRKPFFNKDGHTKLLVVRPDYLSYEYYQFTVSFDKDDEQEWGFFKWVGELSAPFDPRRFTPATPAGAGAENAGAGGAGAGAAAGGAAGGRVPGGSGGDLYHIHLKPAAEFVGRFYMDPDDFNDGFIQSEPDTWTCDGYGQIPEDPKDRIPEDRTVGTAPGMVSVGPDAKMHWHFIRDGTKVERL